MRYQLLKARAKKQKFIKRTQQIKEDSDDSLSDDDEIELSTDFIGELINDKYIVIKYLSKGTFCKVWLVYDMTVDNFYALKIQEGEDNESLLNEIKMLNIIDKPSNISNLIDYFDIKINGNIKTALLFELLGDTLSYFTYDENNSLVTIDSIKKIGKSLLLGIKELHDNNLVHCDIKLDNILFTEVNSNIKNIINEVKEFGMNNNYNLVLQEATKIKLDGLSKSKKKVIKKKIKKKTIKEVYNENKQNILKINNIHNKLNISNNELNLDEANIEEEVKDKIKSDEEEENYDEKYKLDINIDNLKVKLLDLGNTEVEKFDNDEEIYTRCYRPPENIINGSYDKNADIWVYGCLIYELFVGEPIFDFTNCNKYDNDRDRLHLSKMYSILGKMPKEMTQNCNYSEEYFDSKGRILKNRNIELRDLKDELTNRIDIDEEELELVLDFINKALDYNPHTRYTAVELLNHKWLNF